jgi:hypothetical protein
MPVMFLPSVNALWAPGEGGYGTPRVGSAESRRSNGKEDKACERRRTHS